MARKKKLNYADFRFDKDSVMHDAIMRCYREMYKRAQPSADFDSLMKQYNKEVSELVAQGVDKDAAERECSFYERYYLSHNEFCYIVNKYLKAYRFNTVWDDHMQLIIDEAKNGYSDEKYGIPKWECFNKRGKIRHFLDNIHFYHILDKNKSSNNKLLKKISAKVIDWLKSNDLMVDDFERTRYHYDVPNLKKQIMKWLKFDFTGLLSKGLSNLFIKFLENRKWYYRFNMDENQFRGATALGGSPTGNENTVKEYWASQGVDISIDFRNYCEDYFWSEEYGDLDEYLEYWNPDGTRKDVVDKSAEE